MMKTFKEDFKNLRGFLILWLTQSLSALGSAMTAFALVVWSYGQNGSALETAMLSICSYAPYVLVSIFAGAVSDRWSKKTVMLVCDTFAALCTVCVGALLAAANDAGLLARLFGAGKGAGAACLFGVLAVTGVATCLVFRADRHIWALEKGEQTKE